VVPAAVKKAGQDPDAVVADLKATVAKSKPTY
jgi:hypothetical protein